MTTQIPVLFLHARRKLQSDGLNELGTKPATNPVALVSDLSIRKVVFCVQRSGSSATCECKASLPHWEKILTKILMKILTNFLSKSYNKKFMKK